MISTFSFSAWVTIGRLVGDHLWQSTLFAALAGPLTLAFRKNRAQVRNALWLAASVKFLVPFAALVAIGSHFGWRRAAPIVQNPVPSVIEMSTISQPFSRLAAGAQPTVVSHSMASVIPILLLAVWLCGCAVILLTWWRCWRPVAVAVRQAPPVKHGPELDALRRLETVAGITKPVVLVSLDTSLEPGVFGITAPVLLWPRSLAGRLTQAHIEMILAHELSHVRRRDNLAAAIHMVVETLFWFHPLVWWLGARMVAEREHACDEDVLRLGGKPQVYAESVLKVCEVYLESPLACVAGVTGANLKQRMERIMSNRVGATLTGWRKLFLATAGVAVLAVPLLTGVLTAPRLLAQSVAQDSQAAAGGKMAFDVVSIKLNTTGGDICTRVAFSCWMDLGKPGILTGANQSLRDLVVAAYALTPSQARMISGAPKWVDSERFDIQATVGGNPGKEQKRAMLQSLLADRFKLALHHETRQGPIYALVLAKVGKIGPGLTKHSDAAACIDPNAPRPPNPGDSFCGGFLGLNRGGLTHLTGNNTTIATLAEQLGGGMSGDVDRAVVDRTGLNGTFDVTLEYTPRSQIDLGASDPTAPPSLVTALQEQLGLKLVPQTGPVDVLVIDHVEQPSDNSAQAPVDQSPATGGDRLAASVKPSKPGSSLSNDSPSADRRPKIRAQPYGSERPWFSRLRQQQSA